MLHPLTVPPLVSLLEFRTHSHGELASFILVGKIQSDHEFLEYGRKEGGAFKVSVTFAPAPS